MEVRELVGGETVWIDPSKTNGDAAVLMRSRDIGALAVGSDGDLTGIITERDILNAYAEGVDIDVTPVSASMTPNPDTLHPDMTVDEAASWMLGRGYRHLPVVDRGETIGIISIKDILWAISKTE